MEELSTGVRFSIIAKEMNNGLSKILEKINAICFYNIENEELWLEFEQNYEKIKSCIEKILVEAETNESNA